MSAVTVVSISRALGVRDAFWAHKKGFLLIRVWFLPSPCFCLLSLINKMPKWNKTYINTTSIFCNYLVLCARLSHDVCLTARAKAWQIWFCIFVSPYLRSLKIPQLVKPWKITRFWMHVRDVRKEFSFRCFPFVSLPFSSVNFPGSVNVTSTHQKLYIYVVRTGETQTYWTTDLEKIRNHECTKILTWMKVIHIRNSLPKLNCSILETHSDQ